MKKLPSFLFLAITAFSSLFSFDEYSAPGLPIVTVEEKLRLEEIAYASGESEERFMENAALGVVKEAEQMLNFDSTRTVVLLVGKGYKGGSALRAGFLLSQKGYRVEGVLLAPLSECPPLCQKMASQLLEAGAELQLFEKDVPKGDLLIDGLVGTGFMGAAKGMLAQLIEAANLSQTPILAIDIPSGLNANTGDVGTVAIIASRTATMGLPKVGFFLQDGIKHIGELVNVDIGLPKIALNQVRPEAYLRKNLSVNDIFNDVVMTFDELDEKLEKKASLQSGQAFAEENEMKLLVLGDVSWAFTPNQIPLILWKE